ncbi:MAG TPA: DNA translocase FtsK 4TM domain-containing protein [Gaiellaceae bacterium]|nr:DNA translocase FtsK 4TM domain-containing protein [Gaiellaceae bacterium]
MAARKKKRPLRPRVPSRVKKRTKRQRSQHESELLGLALLALGLVLAAILYLGLDGGAVGSWLADVLTEIIGNAAYVLPVALVGLGGLLLARSDLLEVRPFRLGVGVSFLGLMTLLGKDSGGFIGLAIGGTIAALIGQTGAAIVGGALLVGGLLLVTGASTGVILRRTGHAVKRAGTGARRAFEWPSTESVTAEDIPVVSAPVVASVATQHALLDGAEAYPDVVGASAASHEELPLDVEPDELSSAESVFETSSEHSEYRLPDRSVLRASPAGATSKSDTSAKTADLLVRTLSEFGVDATVTGQISGPRVTRYELQLAPGTKVSKVAGLKDDLSYALATTEIRILAPIPGKQAVGVEVPNLSPKLVTLGDIFGDLPATASPLSVWLGKDISGNSVWTDLARMPHLLIAGTTGSGKSGCINTILTSTLLRATPDEVRMILIDPKRIELNYYESIPHLLTPVVSSPKEAATVLMNVVQEMERRYERLSFVRARSLPEANRAFRARGEAPLPYLLVVIDELADLMMVSPQAVEDCVIRLAQKSRAVGIHLVLATQRPSVDVITGMIKANVPSRIAFAVSSQTDSRVILDGAGAESLLGQGDMLFKPLGTSRLQRVQGAYVSEEEVALVVEQCRAQRGQELDESLLEAPEATYEEGEEDGEFDPDEDPLLDKAIEIVVQTQTASVSLLQRRLRVGYTRAGRLIDMLERRGIISGYEGSKPRRVLVSENELNTV